MSYQMHKPNRCTPCVCRIDASASHPRSSNRTSGTLKQIRQPIIDGNGTINMQLLQAEGTYSAGMPRSYLFQLPTKGHISRDCTNQRAERAPPSTGSNAVAVANRAPAGSMRIQSVTLSQAYAASKTTRNAGGTTQQRRQERAGHPAGLSSQKRQTRGEEDSAEVSADMDWNELEPESAAITIEPISKGSGTTSAQSAEVPPVIISAEGAAQKPKHIRPVEPDRVQWKGCNSSKRQ
jgi:hypothetical protein